MGRKATPCGGRSYGVASRHIQCRKICVPDQLDIRQGIFEHGIRNHAIDPEGFSVWSNANAMRGCAQASLDLTEPVRFIRELDSGGFLVAGKIHDYESMKV